MFKQKSETLTIFQQFWELVKVQFNIENRVVQSNWGGEFKSFTKFLVDLGIVHRVICPHTHHQNGSIERKHRHIVEISLALFAQAFLPIHFWDHAFLTAIYLVNRLPTSTLHNQSPCTLYMALLLIINFVVCSGVHVILVLGHITRINWTLDHVSVPFLGYSPSHKG